MFVIGGVFVCPTALSPQAKTELAMAGVESVATPKMQATIKKEAAFVRRLSRVIIMMVTKYTT
jgi:hypothetical protein